ncbi:unnamed protein product, partial [Didymodactylos carnosus]
TEMECNQMVDNFAVLIPCSNQLSSRMSLSAGIGEFKFYLAVR